MKRSLVLTAALALVALSLSAVSAGAQAPTFVRGTVLQLTRTTTPARDRTLPFTFTTRGRLVVPGRYCAPGASPTGPGGNCIPIICPPGATDLAYCFVPSRAVICSGFVTIRFQKRGTTISARNVSLRPDCSYRARTTFHSRLRLRTGVLSVRARFQGNPVLLPRTSSTGRVRAG